MWCSGMGFWGWAMMIGLWGGVAALIVWLVSSARRDEAPRSMAILERRLAAGEIGRDEFEEKRRLLRSTP